MVYRKSFGFSKSESVTAFICGMGRLNYKHIIVETDRISFYFSFSAPKNAFFKIFRRLFFGRIKEFMNFRFFIFRSKKWQKTENRLLHFAINALTLLEVGFKWQVPCGDNLLRLHCRYGDLSVVASGMSGLRVAHQTPFMSPVETVKLRLMRESSAHQRPAQPLTMLFEIKPRLRWINWPWAEATAKGLLLLCTRVHISLSVHWLQF